MRKTVLKFKLTENAYNGKIDELKKAAKSFHVDVTGYSRRISTKENIGRAEWSMICLHGYIHSYLYI